MLPVILMQTDTTVGFLSQNETRLYEIKSRKKSKPFIKVYSSFKDLLAAKNRVPSSQKNSLRRSKKTTFIVKNRAFRVAKSLLDSNILRNSTWHFSTSANESDRDFDRVFCESKADIIIEDKNGLNESSSSSLIKINHVKRKKIR
jgi:tRNA A37 threonylcarbamoyladenosine synthetase subunit TsaC/SUA5/YrdC